MFQCGRNKHYYNFFTIEVEFLFDRNTIAYLLLIEQ